MSDGCLLFDSVIEAGQTAKGAWSLFNTGNISATFRMDIRGEVIMVVEGFVGFRGFLTCIFFHMMTVHNLCEVAGLSSGSGQRHSQSTNV